MGPCASEDAWSHPADATFGPSGGGCGPPGARTLREGVPAASRLAGPACRVERWARDYVVVAGAEAAFFCRVGAWVRRYRICALA